jgi:hypothetical protein
VYGTLLISNRYNGEGRDVDSAVSWMSTTYLCSIGLLKWIVDLISLKR